MKYVDVKNLPLSIQRALDRISYKRPNIGVQERETYSHRDCGGRGQQAFSFTVDIKSGAVSTIHYGSWGGPNMFNSTNVVDTDETTHQLNPGTAHISGSKGGYMYASISFNPEDNMMPKDTLVLTDRLAKVLEIYARYNSRGRKDVFGRIGMPSKEEISTLEELGCIKTNRAGAVTVTSKGRNYEA